MSLKKIHSSLTSIPAIGDKVLESSRHPNVIHAQEATAAKAHVQVVHVNHGGKLLATSTLLQSASVVVEMLSGWFAELG